MTLQNCPLTGWEIIPEPLNPYQVRNYQYFKVRHGINKYFFLLENELVKESALLQKNQHILRWLILNDNFIKNHNYRIRENENDLSWDVIESSPDIYGINLKEYQKYISEYPNIPPEEKLNHFLNTLFKQSDESYYLRKKPEDLLMDTGFRNIKEMKIYINVLIDKAYIEHRIEETSVVYEDPNNEICYNFQFLFNGIQEVARLNESGQNSKRCFVAMSFDKSMKETREAIRQGIKEAKYDAIFIDEINPEADKTINDAIIAEIKRSKFLVADFTKQSNGVYFEAGYALGRGLKVIYCCEEKDFKKNSHFDLKPFSHILYSSAEELSKRLKYKIEAWIE